jgi:hypothetical protein
MPLAVLVQPQSDRDGSDRTFISHLSDASRLRGRSFHSFEHFTERS